MGLGGFIARYKTDPQITPLGRRRKRLASLTLGIGLVLLALPLVKTNPPVMGRSYWSVLDIVWQLNSGQLHRETLPVYLVSACALMLGCFLALFIPYAERALLAMSVASILFCIRAFDSDRNGFESMFYGNFPDGLQVPDRVRFSGLVFALLVVLGLVFYILISEGLDVARSGSARR